jgi:6-phosphofructokinase 2
MPRILTVTPNPALDLATSAEVLLDASKIRCEPARIDPGGGGINVARVVHRLGGEVLALYLAGGATGARLRGLLDAEGLASHCIDIAGETRESFSVWERATGREFRFVLPGPELAPGEWQAGLDAVARLAPPGGYLVSSGSLPPGTPADFHAEAARRARAVGCRVVVDASGESLAAALAVGVDLVKPSLRELREFTGLPLASEADRLAAARALVASGQAAIVALSLGAEGALLVARDLALRAAPLTVEVATTTGAGDSFLAGMVCALARNEPLAEAFRTGMAAGAAALLRPGTALSRAQDVQQLRQAVRIAELS